MSLSLSKPRVFPKQLYDVIMLSGMNNIYRLGDKDMLMTNSKPVTYDLTIPGQSATPVVCYSTTLLKIWLKHICYKYNLMTYHLVLNKSKKFKRTLCFDPMKLDKKASYYLVANIIVEVVVRLLMGTDDNRLVTPTESGGSSSKSNISSINNMVKIARMDLLGYDIWKFSESDYAIWNDFELSEKVRLTFLLRSNPNAPVIGKDTTYYPDDVASALNMATVSAMRYNPVTDPILVGIDYMKIKDDKSIDTIKVDPEIVKLTYTLESKKVLDRAIKVEARAVKASKIKSTTSYSSMIKEYKELTNYGLSLLTEKKDKTLDFRMREISNMKNAQSNDPTIRFRHDVNANRIAPM
jgi:hypothetical protein